MDWKAPKIGTFQSFLFFCEIKMDILGLMAVLSFGLTCGVYLEKEI